MRYGRDYDRMIFRAGGYDRRPYRQDAPRSGYDRHLFDTPPWGWGNARGGYRPLGYHGADSMGAFNAGPASRINLDTGRRWTVPWNRSVPGIGLGHGLPYGMGERGRYF
ncbi:MAG TPA: hypothetical protein VFL93_10330 [Longimicrobiaceae bacterium]|jgi:hypothetical protein|nr:hypothetical protein [Longimicrobiaceae bacterium]